MSGEGLITDWDLKTTLDGCMPQESQLFSPGDHSFCASTGRYAGRKAADYALQVSEALSLMTRSLEKARVYAPIHLAKDWTGRNYTPESPVPCSISAVNTRVSLYLRWAPGTEGNRGEMGPQFFALDPHKLMRGLEDLNLLTCAQAIIQASLARKASSRLLDFQRIDYPQMDPPEWNKFLTIKLENNQPKIGELPLGFLRQL